MSSDLLARLSPEERQRYLLTLLFHYLSEEDDNANVVLASRELSVFLVQSPEDCHLQVCFLRQSVPLTLSGHSYVFVGEGRFCLHQSGAVSQVTFVEPFDPPEIGPLLRHAVAQQVLIRLLEAFHREQEAYVARTFPQFHKASIQPTKRIP
ncbi:MAG: hypothetical protein H0T73_07060 [Ardenticatenales bacterium]|nr:hypothetical protein [Ardenticatenales bacterium]